MSTETKPKRRPYHVQLAIHQLRVNIKSLAAEAKFIRSECYKAANTDIKNALHYHRVSRVRREARMAQLALAYFRGVPYRRVEQKTHDMVWPHDLHKKLQRFATTSIEEVRNWLWER